MPDPVKFTSAPPAIDQLVQDITDKVTGGIEFGNPQLLLNDTAPLPEAVLKENVALGITYKRGPKLKDMQGQYIFLEIPHTTNIVTFTIKHDLQRVPVGFTTLQMLGLIAVSRGNSNIVANIAPGYLKGIGQITNERMTFKYLKTSSDTHIGRALILLY